MGYIVVGTFRRTHKDSEGETQECKTYAEAVELKKLWQQNRKYKKVVIIKG